MRKKNQTISLRDLVKKMKRHSTLTIAVTAIATAVLCSGLLYICLPAADAQAQEQPQTAKEPSQTDMSGQLQEIMAYLKELDQKLVTGQNSLDELKKQNELMMEKEAESRSTTTLEKSVAGLGTSMQSLHDQITQTGQQIQTLQTMMAQGNQAQQDEMNRKFTDITDSLTQISQNYTAAQAQLESLLKNMSDAEKEHHQELVQKLTELQSGMTDTDARNLQTMTDRLKDMESAYLEQLRKLETHVDNSITDMDTHMSESIGTLSTAVENQYQMIQQQFGGDNRAVMELLAETRKDLNEKYDQVFRRASDGKKLVASALLTKGIEIGGDATFAEYAEAIRKMPQQLVIGVDHLPGTISYDYHHHIGADAGHPGTEQVAADSKGGCYTVPVYHIHEGSSSENGGCYTLPQYHHHSGNCYTSYCYDALTETVVGEEGVENGYARHYYYCGGCKSTFSGTNGWHKHWQRTLICGKGENQIDSYAPSCGMTPQTIVGYRPGCGLSEGQIIAAHIVYEKGQNPEMTSLRTSAFQGQMTSALAESKLAMQNHAEKAVPPEGTFFEGVLTEKEIAALSDAEKKEAEEKTDSAEEVKTEEETESKPAEQEQTQPKQEEQKTAEQSGKTENTGAEAPPPEQKEETAEEDMTEDTISLEKFQNGEIPLP